MMPIDTKKMFSSATKSDVAMVALSASSAVMHIKWALAALSKGKNIDNYIEQIEEDSQKLSEAFDELTGWTST